MANLSNVDCSKMTADQLRAHIATLTADNVRLAAAKAGRLTFKVQTVKKDKAGKVIEGEAGSGAVSLYGLGRFPVTLYGSQWRRLIDLVKSGAPEEFLEANAAIIATRD